MHSVSAPVFWWAVEEFELRYFFLSLLIIKNKLYTFAVLKTSLGIKG